jgi:O-antigen/teichoic acid export membrane protein
MSALSDEMSVLWRSRFARQVATLSFGTVAAQAVAYFTMPLLTRLYTAEQFGQASVFTSVGLVMSQVATAKYELAINIAPDEDEALRTWLISLVAAMTGAFVLTAAVAFFGAAIAGALGIPLLGGWLFLLPVTLLLMGVQQALAYRLNRQSEFGIQSAGQAAQALGTSFGRIGLGWSGIGAPGLILGTVAGLACINVTYGVIAIRHGLRRAGALMKDVRGLLATARRYADFPLYYCGSSVLNAIGSAVPVLFINKLHSSGEAGQFNLTVLMIGVPSSIIAAAVGQVFLQRLSEQWNRGEPIQGLVRAMNGRMLALVAAPAVAVMLVAPGAFALVFGSGWRLAGEYARITVLAFACQFVVSPCAAVFPVVGAIKTGSLWKVLFFFTTLATAVVCRNCSVRVYLMAFAAHDFVLYGLQWALAWRCTVRAQRGVGPAMGRT